MIGMDVKEIQEMYAVSTNLWYIYIYIVPKLFNGNSSIAVTWTILSLSRVNKRCVTITDFRIWTKTKITKLKVLKIIEYKENLENII